MDKPVIRNGIKEAHFYMEDNISYVYIKWLEKGAEKTIRAPINRIKDGASKELVMFVSGLINEYEEPSKTVQINQTIHLDTVKKVEDIINLFENLRATSRSGV